jgi:hypothetical protein
MIPFIKYNLRPYFDNIHVDDVLGKKLVYFRQIIGRKIDILNMYDIPSDYKKLYKFFRYSECSEERHYNNMIKFMPEVQDLQLNPTLDSDNKIQSYLLHKAIYNPLKQIVEQLYFGESVCTEDTLCGQLIYAILNYRGVTSIPKNIDISKYDNNIIIYFRAIINRPIEFINWERIRKNDVYYDNIINHMTYLIPEYQDATDIAVKASYLVYIAIYNQYTKEIVQVYYGENQNTLDILNVTEQKINDIKRFLFQYVKNL